MIFFALYTHPVYSEAVLFYWICVGGILDAGEKKRRERQLDSWGGRENSIAGN